MEHFGGSRIMLFSKIEVKLGSISRIMKPNIFVFADNSTQKMCLSLYNKFTRP